MGEKTRELARVVAHLSRHTAFSIGPVEVSSTVVNTWIIMAVLFLLVFLATRHLSEERPRGVQLFLEVMVDFFHSLIDTGMGPAGRQYLPMVGTLFIFILFMNLSWFIPRFIPPTTDIMTTAALGITTIVLIQIIAIRKRGFVGYIRRFGEPIPLMAPMNVIEEVVKPFSLAIRLFGNMFGDEMVATILFILVPFLAPTPVMALGVLMGTIQAYIFSLLTVTYLASATQGH